MEFEFDEAKSRANRLKHGLDFVEAQAIWLDDDRVEIPARSEGEDRWLVIGWVEDRLWSAVTTIRHGRIRIISVRRSRPEEVAFHEGEGL